MQTDRDDAVFLHRQAQFDLCMQCTCVRDVIGALWVYTMGVQGVQCRCVDDEDGEESSALGVWICA